MFVFSNADGAFKVESVGFHNLKADAEAEGLTTRDLIKRKWLETNRPEVTFASFNDHSLLVVTVKRSHDQKTVEKYWIGSKTANGYAVKSLKISYPWSRRSEFDPLMQRIEQSWYPFEGENRGRENRGQVRN